MVNETLSSLAQYLQAKSAHLRETVSHALNRPSPSSSSGAPAGLDNTATNTGCASNPNKMASSASSSKAPNNPTSQQTLNGMYPGGGMSTDEFRKVGKEMVDYIADYLDNIHKRRVVPAIEPGYLRSRLPEDPPKKPEPFDTVLKDFEEHIMPGLTHWQHPRFHAYFPAGNSFPSILADMLSDGLGCMGFSWAACPAMTELEMIMLDWFGRMLGLPEEFLPFTENGRGGGVIQSSASECILVGLLAARFEMMRELRRRFPFVEEGLLMSKLIAYCSKEAHSSVEKACMIGMVKLRILETDSKFRLRGDTLRNAITEDRNMGLIPFFVSLTLGTTSCCSFDCLNEIGPLCGEEELWLHVDAAYAGSAFICPEFRHLMKGIEFAMSFNTNPNKWMLINYDCSTMWVRDRFKLTQALVVDPLYLQHSWTDKAIDYRHWGIPLSRRFRALKLWFVIRTYGVDGLQKYIREHVRLAKKFEQLLKADDRFELVGEVHMGLVCFRMKGSEEVNQRLLTKLNSSGRIHMVPASLNDRFVIRFCVCSENATDRDIGVAYEIISQAVEHVAHDTAQPLLEIDEIDEIEDLLHDGSGVATTVDGMRRQSLAASAEQLGADLSDTDSTLGAGNPEDSRYKLSLAAKRSFFTRMVSDPKCYNPKIVRHLNVGTRRKMSEDVKRDLCMRMAIEKGKRDALGSSSTVPRRPTRLIDQPEGQQRTLSEGDDRHGGQSEEEVSIPQEQTGIQTPL